MGKVIVGIMMSLDGFISDANGSVSRLYPDFDALLDADIFQEAMRSTGAVVMGRRTYDMGNGDYTGYEFQTPIFVLTHDVPETPAKGENDKLKFHFVTEGIESAIRQAKAAAGDKDVTLVGGASTAQQCLRAGLCDELQVDIQPVFLGDGLRFFENLSTAPVKLEATDTTRYAGVVHLVFRVSKE